MLYYGDRVREVSPHETLRRIGVALRDARGAGTRAEAALETALVEAGQLAQALADHADAASPGGEDPAAADAHELVAAIARALHAEYARAGGARAGNARRGAWPEPGRLASRELPRRLRVRVPEGFAHYAVHPATYAAAAAPLRASARGPIAVIGIRSIGTSLGAVVAAACGAETFVTVRPVGHPYHRRLAVPATVARRVLDAIAHGATFAVVDEGPGLSGSSFEAVASWLREAGADPARLVFFPSHGGTLGPAAPEARRAWWQGVDRRTATFEEVVLPRLAAAARDATGAERLEDAGAGQWRRYLAPEVDWPPVFAQQERRKYVATGSEGAAFVLRFAGIGPYGAEALARAEALADAGFAPRPLFLAHGHLAIPAAVAPGRWRPVSPPARDLARYLELRAAMGASPEDGASAEELLAMIRANSATLGPAAVDASRLLEAGARRIEHVPRAVVDGKLEPWEWTISPGGKAWKLDATDHASGHDLAGCQPAAWDVAAAHVELGLPWEAAVALAARVSPGVDVLALAFLTAAYAAHRVGRWWFALQVEGDPRERLRIEATLGRYRDVLRRRLAGGGG